jgi:hypothetical protein
VLTSISRDDNDNDNKLRCCTPSSNQEGCLTFFSDGYVLDCTRSLFSAIQFVIPPLVRYSRETTRPVSWSVVCDGSIVVAA